MRKISLAAILVGLVPFVVFLSCSDGEQPLEPLGKSMSDISDAVHDYGNPYFYFLPPLAPDPSPSGTYDGSLSPEVRICELSGSACTSTIATLEARAGSGVTPGEEHYIANWRTDEYPLTPDRSYRIEVYVAGTRLGFADVEIAGTNQEASNLGTGETFSLKDGRTLPIRFRIERGAVYVVDGSGATVTSQDGAVTLDFPEDALEGPVGVTVLPSPDYPSVPYSPMPGTVYNFGPDGIAFAEPAMLMIRYDETDIPEDVAEADLGIRKLVDGEWLPLPGSAVDVDGNCVSVAVDGFSTYAVVQLPGPTRDLSQIVFVSDRDGDDEIYMMYTDGSGLVQLTNNDAFDWMPAVSPDGSKVAFASNRDGDFDIYVMQADGSGLTNLTDDYSGQDVAPAWSPGERYLVFSSSRPGLTPGYYHLWMRRSDGLGPTQVTQRPFNDAGASWGRSLTYQIVFSRDLGNGDYSIRAVDVPCLDCLPPPEWGISGLEYSPGFNGSPEWDLHHLGIIFASDRTGDREIFFWAAADHSLTNLTNNPSFDASPTLHPEGTHIAFVRAPQLGTAGDICVMNADGTGQRCIANAADDYAPAWRIVSQ